MKTKRIKQIKKISVLIISITLLNGCASMNSKFDCPMKPGIRCESLDQVNARVDRAESHAYAHDASDTDDEDKFSSHTALNNKQKIMHIWIAPYVDKEGNYHEGSSIYSVKKTKKIADGE